MQQKPPPPSSTDVTPPPDPLGELVDAVLETDRLVATALAWRAELIDGFRGAIEVRERQAGPGSGVTSWTVAERARRTCVAELATAMRLPERSVEQLLGEARALVHELPVAMAALRAGEVSYRHAQRIVDHALSLPPESRRDFETEIVPVAAAQTVAKLERRARVVRERMHPGSIGDRHRAAAADRHVALESGRDGMAWLTAHLPVVAAAACFDRVCELARLAAPDVAGDDRTEAQRRADVFSDLLTEGVTPGGVGVGVRASVSVTVPAMTLLGHSEQGGHLAGHGPIDADTARRLAGTATSWTRILTHPETGAILSVGRETYTVPADLRRFLILRDETCRFPGCSRAADRSDLDHSEDWARDGRTAHDNLAHLCRGHHRLKHQTAWRVEHVGGGTLHWTSPLNRDHITDPAVRIVPG